MAVDVIHILRSEKVEADLKRAAGILEAGGLVLLPTETVYGVAGRIDRAETLERLKKLRGPSGQSSAGKSSGGPSLGDQPWTLHLARPDQAWDYVSADSEFAQRLVKKLWPGPVGLSFDVPAADRKRVDERLGITENELFGDGVITLRCPDHAVFAEITSRFEAPLVLTKLSDVNSSLPKNVGAMPIDVDLIIDAGPTRYSKPSTLLRVFADRYEIVRDGVFDDRILQRQLRTTVVFVCSGNTCRSPMAEALTRKILAESLSTTEGGLEAKGYSVASAGVYAVNGTRATPQAVEAVKSMGADLTSHRSQALTPELLHQADVVYVMGRSHAHATQIMSSSANVRALDSAGDIEDPIGADLGTYKQLAERMEKLIRDRLKEDKIVG